MVKWLFFRYIDKSTFVPMENHCLQHVLYQRLCLEHAKWLLFRYFDTATYVRMKNHC